MTKVEILNDWFQRIWIAGEIEAIPGFFTPRLQASGVMSGLEMGPEDFSALIPAMRAKVRDFSVEIVHAIEQGDWLWTLQIIRGRARETGAPLEFTGQLAVRFEGDKIAEAYNHYDLIAVFEQLGQMPPDTLGLCLMGERLS